jgi:hypothetical protein
MHATPPRSPAPASPPAAGTPSSVSVSRGRLPPNSLPLNLWGSGGEAPGRYGIRRARGTLEQRSWCIIRVGPAVELRAQHFRQRLGEICECGLGLIGHRDSFRWPTTAIWGDQGLKAAHGRLPRTGLGGAAIAQSTSWAVGFIVGTRVCATTSVGGEIFWRGGVCPFPQRRRLKREEPLPFAGMVQARLPAGGPPPRRRADGTDPQPSSPPPAFGNEK